MLKPFETLLMISIGSRHCFFSAFDEAIECREQFLNDGLYDPVITIVDAMESYRLSGEVLFDAEYEIAGFKKNISKNAGNMRGDNLIRICFSLWSVRLI